MSKIKFEGNASGTGTLTIAAPNTNTDRTLTLPDGAGEILTDASNISTLSTQNIPAFRVHKSAAQSFSDSTWTKNTFDVEDLDSHGWWDSTTNYRYTPQIAGWYFFSYKWGSGNSVPTAMNSAIYKNGSAVAKTTLWTVGGIDDYTPQVTDLIYLNGSTDYVEFYVYQYGGGTGINPDQWSHASGFLVRAD